MPEDGVVSEQKHPINLILGKQSRPKGRNNPKRMRLLLSLGWDPGDQASPTPADVRIQGLGQGVECMGSPLGDIHCCLGKVLLRFRPYPGGQTRAWS